MFPVRSRGGRRQYTKYPVSDNAGAGDQINILMPPVPSPSFRVIVVVLN